ncbi:MAG: hypothetical protein ACRDLK_04995, partial [Gaiellaceae bacterium]
SGLRIVALALLLAPFLTSGAAARPHASAGTIVFAADRASSLSGEIYRLDRTGKRVDLSKSPAFDGNPVVSPDGKLVAFSSNRGGGKTALYTVRLDGTHLQRVSPFFALGLAGLPNASSIAWSPDGKRLLAALGKGLWAGGRMITHATVYDAVWVRSDEIAWLDDAATVHVVSSSGEPLWRTSGKSLLPSGTGRLAVTVPGPAIEVYDASGHRLAKFAGADPVWSPTGTELASLTGTNLHQLQVRLGGTGRPFVDVRIAARNGNIQWLGDGRLRVFRGSGWLGYDVRRRRPWTLPAGFRTFNYPDVATRSGTAVVASSYAGRVESLAVATLAGGVGRSLASAAYCDDESPFDALQFTPDGSSLVYQSRCASPSADIYAMRADGTGLRNVTATPTDETDPAVSPDGARIAYAEQYVGGCKGCDQTLWEMNADGSGQHALTQASTQASLWFDDEPSFSPDGGTIVFEHSTAETAALVEIPAAGGPQRTLPVAGVEPAWGATRIAFWNRKDSVKTMLPDGSQPVVVAADPYFAGPIAWSGNGRLAWLDEAANGRLSLDVSDGKRVAKVSLGSLHRPYRGSGLAWSPDGTRLAFTAADAEGIADVWTVAPDGTALTRVTHDLGAVAGLSWSGG